MNAIGAFGSPSVLAGMAGISPSTGVVANGLSAGQVETASPAKNSAQTSLRAFMPSSTRGVANAAIVESAHRPGREGGAGSSRAVAGLVWGGV